jgi:hypothetical protein
MSVFSFKCASCFNVSWCKSRIKLLSIRKCWLAGDDFDLKLTALV